MRFYFEKPTKKLKNFQDKLMGLKEQERKILMGYKHQNLIRQSFLVSHFLAFS